MDLRYLLNPVDVKNAERFLGKECYVADDINDFWNLDKCHVRTLKKVLPDSSYPFICREVWKYCVPVEIVTESRLEV